MQFAFMAPVFMSKGVALCFRAFVWETERLAGAEAEANPGLGSEVVSARGPTVLAAIIHLLLDRFTFALRKYW